MACTLTRRTPPSLPLHALCLWALLAHPLTCTRVAAVHEGAERKESVLEIRCVLFFVLFFLRLVPVGVPLPLAALADQATPLVCRLAESLMSSTFAPPPPPAGVVVPPPPPAMIPVPPAAVPANPSTASGAEGNVVKPGGVALDMSNHFGPPKNVPKKSLPPWERKKLSTPLSGSSPRADNSTPPPGPVAATSKPLSPVAVPLPHTVANAPAVVTRKSLSTASLTTSPQPCASPSCTSAMSSAATAATGVSSPPVISIPPPPPPVHPVVQAVSSSAATTASPLPLVSSSAAPPPRPTPDAQEPLPAPASATAGVPTLPLPSPGVNQAATVAAAAIHQGTAQPTLPTSSPAAIAATDHIVQEAMRELRPPLLSPMLTVLAPHVVFQGDEQQWVVPPLGPVPSSKRKKVLSAAVASAGSWHNSYDLKPSPSFDAAQHDGSEPLVTPAATSSTRRQWTSNAVINSAKAKSNWRETYWKHVDVHRYVARRYFGAPPPLEQ